jgi:hypothetical protein
MTRAHTHAYFYENTMKMQCGSFLVVEVPGHARRFHDLAKAAIAASRVA